MTDQFLKDVEYVISVLRDADYDPYEQLYAYAVTGNETFITRKGNARNMAAEMNREQLIEYVLPYVKPNK